MCGNKLSRDKESLEEQGKIIRMLEEQKAVCSCCGSTLSWNARDVHFSKNREKQYIYCPFDEEQISVDTCITK